MKNHMSLLSDPVKLKANKAFYMRSSVEKPVFGSWLFGFYIHEQFPNLVQSLTPGLVKPEHLDVDLFLQDVDRLLLAYKELDDDLMFSTGVFYGIPWMEAIMGCPVYFKDTTIWADPCILDWKDYSWEEPTLENPWAQKLLDLLAALINHSSGRYHVSATLMRGVADMCAAMRGSTKLALDLYDQPEAVRRLAEVCANVWIEVGQAQLDLIPEVDEMGHIASVGSLRCWLPGKGIWLQDDAASVLSPNFYEQLFLPQVKKIVSHFPYVVMHLHGTYLWLIDQLLEIKEIDALELNYDAGIVQLEEILPAWKKIQTKKPCIAFATATLEELAFIADQLDPIGLSLQTLASTVEEARQ
ncbi:MAG: hypothetical protein PVG14_07255, partial [Anaerolineales bacterium]